MRLIHFSKKATLDPRSMEQSVAPHHAFKPNGLWVSDEDSAGWSKWCEGESFGIGHNQFEVEIQPGAKVLMLGTDDAILSFNKAFEYRDERFRSLYINWQNVARYWQGIVITPYSWSLRLDPRCNWYYGWDCASGCFWDAAAIVVAPA